MKTTKHRIKVWVVTWPKGTTPEWKDEMPKRSRPVDYLPICTDLGNQFSYYDRNEKRTVFGAPVAVFFNRDEANAYETSNGNYFTVRSGYLEVK